MRRIVAAHPTIQAILCLLAEGVLLTDMLCALDAFVAELPLDPVPRPMPPRCTSHDDDYAYVVEPGLANCATAQPSPLEAQGCGGSHKHTRAMGVPRAGEGKLRHTVEQDVESLREALQHTRDELL